MIQSSPRRRGTFNLKSYNGKYSFSLRWRLELLCSHVWTLFFLTLKLKIWNCGCEQDKEECSLAEPAAVSHSTFLQVSSLLGLNLILRTVRVWNCPPWFSCWKSAPVCAGLSLPADGESGNILWICLCAVVRPLSSDLNLCVRRYGLKFISWYNLCDNDIYHNMFFSSV